MRIKTSKSGGFTLVEIMIVVAIIGLLASIAVPNFVRSRKIAQQKTCLSNLRNIEGAMEMWATELNKSDGTAVTYNDIKAYLKNAVVCPAGGTSFDDSYTITTVDAPASCQRVPSGSLAHVIPQTGQAQGGG